MRLGGEEETICSQVRRQEGSQVGAQFLLLTASDVSDGQARLKNKQTNEMKTGISVFADRRFENVFIHSIIGKINDLIRYRTYDRVGTRCLPQCRTVKKMPVKAVIKSDCVCN